MDLDLLTTILHTHSWLYWVNEDDWWGWGWLERKARRHINKRPVGQIAPPFIISFLATGNWPKIKLSKVEFVQTLLKIIHLASRKSYRSLFAQINQIYQKWNLVQTIIKNTNLVYHRKSYLVIIIPNSYEKLKKNNNRHQYLESVQTLLKNYHLAYMKS